MNGIYKDNMRTYIHPFSTYPAQGHGGAAIEQEAGYTL